MATKNPFQGTDVDPFEAARDTETGEIKREMPKAAATAEAPKQQSFGQAFAAARKAGDKTFMFGGKKFTTERADDKPAAKAAPAKSRDEMATASRRAGQENMRAIKTSQAMKSPGRVGPTKERAEAMAPQKKAEAPKPVAKTEESSTSTARKSRREGVKKDPSQMVERARPSAASRTRYAEGGSVRGSGIAKQGVRKCKIV